MAGPPYTKLILTALAKAKGPLTARQVLESSPEFECLRSTHVMLSHLVKRGYVTNEGKQPCSSCGATASAYRITDDGRIRLRGLS